MVVGLHVVGMIRLESQRKVVVFRIYLIQDQVGVKGILLETRVVLEQLGTSARLHTKHHRDFEGLNVEWEAVEIHFRLEAALDGGAEAHATVLLVHDKDLVA